MKKNSLAFLHHDNKYLIPYITNGYLGYIAILIVIYKYNVLEINNILPKLEVTCNVLKQYKNISQKNNMELRLFWDHIFHIYTRKFAK